MNSASLEADRVSMIFNLHALPRTWGLAALLAGSLTALVAGHTVTEAALRIGMLITGCGVALAGLWISTRVDRVEIRPHDGVVNTLRGNWPLLWKARRPLRDYDRIVLEAEPGPDAFGEEGARRTLFLCGRAGRLPLVKGSGGQSMNVMAEKVASSLGWPVPQEVVVAVSTRPLFQQAITVLAWTSMGALALAAIWPGGSSNAGAAGARGVFDFTGPRSGVPDSIFARGTSLYRRGEFATAEGLFRQALIESPNNPDILNMLAYALADQQKLDEALRTAQRALSQAPRNWMILDTVGEMHQRRMEYKEAAPYYRQALRYADSAFVSETNCKYGETLLALGQRQAGIDYLKRAVALYERPWSERAANALTRLGINPSQIPRQNRDQLQAPIQPQRF